MTEFPQPSFVLEYSEILSADVYDHFISLTLPFDILHMLRSLIIVFQALRALLYINLSLLQCCWCFMRKLYKLYNYKRSLIIDK
jgi:hypothetical protein